MVSTCKPQPHVGTACRATRLTRNQSIALTLPPPDLTHSAALTDFWAQALMSAASFRWPVCKAGDRSALSLIADPGSSMPEVTQPARPPSEEDGYQGQSGVLTIGIQGYWKESGFKGSL